MKAIFILLITFYASASYGMWAKFAYLSPETETELGMSGLVSKLTAPDGTVTIRITAKSYSFKIATLIETENPLSISAQESLRYLLWSGDNPEENIVFSSRLSPIGTSRIEEVVKEQNGEGKQELYYEINTQICNRNLYVYIDSPYAIDDGGYWYSVDLSKYLDRDDC
ncbi:hypothetical protein [Arenicella xantha]|nr:hypothetical protein [Arenicella xantha]